MREHANDLDTYYENAFIELGTPKQALFVMASQRVHLQLEMREAEKGAMPRMPLEFEEWCKNVGIFGVGEWMGTEYQRYLEHKRLQLEEFKHTGKYKFSEFKFKTNLQ